MKLFKVKTVTQENKKLLYIYLTAKEVAAACGWR